MLVDDDQNRFAEALTSCINTFLTGKMWIGARTLFSGARLTAIAKKKKGDVRPVAAGMLIRRGAASILARRVEDRVKSVAGERQFGVQCKDGALCFLKSFTAWYEHVMANPRLVLFKSDLSNAFNAVKRRKIKEILEREAPELLQYFETVYSKHAPLVCADGKRLTSQRGVHQGDPCGTYIFCLLLAVAAKRLKLDKLTEHWASYIDDMFWIADEDTLVALIEESSVWKTSMDSNSTWGSARWSRLAQYPRS
jgi:hypothetical protein